MQDHQYRFEDDGTFVIENYHAAKPFSSFLPGMAGLWGIPLWLYYVNRGQAVACFGTQDKDHAIMEFQSANLHHRRVSTEGFRTLLKVTRDGATRFYEPFRSVQEQYEVSNRLAIRFDSLVLEEVNETLGLKVRVEYLPIPNEPFAALARSVTLTELSGSAVEVELVDGAPKIQPYFIRAEHLQRLPFITEAYIKVQDLEADAPFLNEKALPSDTPETEFVEAGHFFFGWQQGSGERLKAIVDPSLVFGDMLDLIRPHRFLSDAWDPSADQEVNCLTPSAMVHWTGSLRGGGTATLHLAIGKARDLAQARTLPQKFADEGYLPAKASESRRQVQGIRHRFFLNTSSPELNHYGPQTFLDNALRGGLPITLPAGEDGQFVFHVYSRRHGDLERDYNNFLLSPTFFSQGNGAFRDVNQNRRSDVWFNPDVAGENVKFFFDLLQPDGFNPLLVKGAQFHVIDAGKLRGVLSRHIPDGRVDAVAEFLTMPWSPGELFEFLQAEGIAPGDDPTRLLRDLLGISEKLAEAEFENGYWCDHWYYNFDQLEQFVAIFPDRSADLLVHDRSLTYWDPDMRVLGRDEKTVRYTHGGIRHIDSLTVDEDKARLIASRRELPRCVRTQDGKGKVYRTNLLEKILCLVANKAASISPSGIGVEMDGGRPGWHDSINGLPGLFGASTSETFHLLRGVRLTRRLAHDAGLGTDYAQEMPIEIAELIDAVSQAAETYATADADTRDHEYWGTTAAAKEAYRREVRMGFKGLTTTLGWEQIERFLSAVEARTEAAVLRAYDPQTKLPVTYVAHEAAEVATLMEGDQPKRTPRGFECVRVDRFEPRVYPLFLEAPSHAMRIERDAQAARAMWLAMRSGPLFDEKLKMYIVGDSVQDESSETGRIWAWPAGWFENENVFLHMEHKYLLATLQAGLAKEFFEDFRNCFIPFQPTERYARSPIENTSFIVSSRHPREAYHGRGFLPRSSGTTAEVLQILLIMSFGQRPFRMEDGELTLRLEPVLDGWLFSEEARCEKIVAADGETRQVDLPAGSYTATFLGEVLVTYVNPSRKATFGDGAAKITRIELTFADGSTKEIEGNVIRGSDARDVRNRKVRRIVATMD